MYIFNNPKYLNTIEQLIRYLGWVSICIGALAIYKKNIELFLIWQLIANSCGFIWSNYLQKKISWDTCTSLIITIIAVITKDVYAVYFAMLIRSINYALIAERLFKLRNEEIK